MNKFKIGEKVRICEDGLVYPSYNIMAALMRAKKWRGKDYGACFGGKTGIIKRFKSHENNRYRKLALIDLGSEEIIIDIDGLSRLNDCQRCEKRLRCLTGER